MVMIVDAPPRSTDGDELQALIEEARRRARRRRRNASGVLVAALFIAGGYLLVARAFDGPTDASVGLARSSSVPLSVGAGPFWYVRTIGTMRAPRCLKQLAGVMGRCVSTVWFEVGMSTETWLGRDGTMRERSVEVWQRFASAADRRRWLASNRRVPLPISIAQGDALDVGSGHFPAAPFGAIGSEAPPAEGPPGAMGGPLDVGDGLFTYRQLLALAVPPGAALRRLDNAETALGRRYAQTLSRWHSPAARVIARDDRAPLPKRDRPIQQLLVIAHLSAAPIPARVRLALFHAATALPRVMVTTAAHAGVTVQASAPHWSPIRFTFDRRTGELLTGLPADGGPPDVAGPESTVTAQGPVSSITAHPTGVKPIRGVGAPPLWPSPPPPPIETISPTTGGPSTVFTVLLPATAGERPRPAPTAWLGITGSAGTGTYRGGETVIDRCLSPHSIRVWPATTIHRAGKLVYVYRIKPHQFRLRAWCPGNYSLGLQTFPNPLPPRYTTPPYTGPSGTSVYFRVN